MRRAGFTPKCRSQKVREWNVWWLQGGSMLSLQTCCLTIAHSGRPLTCQSCRPSCQPVSGIGRWEGETTLLQGNAYCMIVIPRDCSQEGGFNWGDQIGFDTSTSEENDRLLALKAFAAVKPGRMKRSKVLNAAPDFLTSRCEHSPCMIIIQ